MKVTFFFRKLVPSLRNDRERPRELTLIGPSPYDDPVQVETKIERSNVAMARWTTRIGEIAKQRGAGFVDMGTALNPVNTRLQAADPAASIVGKDRGHPRPARHLLMAMAIRKAQNVDPEVSRFQSDAGSGNRGPLFNCAVEELRTAPQGVDFLCREKTLPFVLPLEGGMRGAAFWGIAEKAAAQIEEAGGPVPRRRPRMTVALAPRANPSSFAAMDIPPVPVSRFARRDFLRRTAWLAAATATSPWQLLAQETATLPFANGERPLVRYPQKRPLLRLTSRPPQLETPFAVFNEGLITPNDAFFVRYHLPQIPTEIGEGKGRTRTALSSGCFSTFSSLTGAMGRFLERADSPTLRAARSRELPKSLSSLRSLR